MFAQVTGAFIPVVIAVAQITSGHRVLDVATGTRVAQATARGVNSSAEVVAGDVSAAMLDGTKPNPKKRFDGEAFPYPEAPSIASLANWVWRPSIDPHAGLKIAGRRGWGRRQ